MAGAFFAGAAFSAALVMGMADSHTMGSLLAAPGELWVHELEKPRVVCVGTGTRRTGLAKRAWRATASRRARSRASSACDGWSRAMMWSSGALRPQRSANCWMAKPVTASSSSAADRRASALMSHPELSSYSGVHCGGSSSSGRGAGRAGAG